MSASYLVDLGGTCALAPSLPGSVAPSPSGLQAGLSGQLVGDICNLIYANAATQVYVQGKSVNSGPLVIGVQTSDSTTSGTFTDPTSGLPVMPSWFSSGGFLRIGLSGQAPLSDQVSGQFLQSGFLVSAFFQRPHQYARLFIASGQGRYDGPVAAGFIGQLRTTGSGGGFSYSPGSGAVNV